jgi:hypothetical protein
MSSCILDFHNWNRVKVRYCDGGSFTGDGADAVSETHISMHGFFFRNGESPASASI